jgi:molybdopterin converting factor small subunit
MKAGVGDSMEELGHRLGEQMGEIREHLGTLGGTLRERFGSVVEKAKAEAEEEAAAMDADDEVRG